ncbi:polysaccharide export protein [Isoalcanivorax beigongshangi]|uniref:Polysaccharide export protein n=1 Tax=Isoalcanivorax beigongshangi TaxID=3238810 RepID=A0ABV4AFM9_9GAMM
MTDHRTVAAPQARAGLAPLFKAAAALTLAATLGACTLVPGSHIPQTGRNPWFGGEAPESEAEAVALPELLRLHEISPTRKAPEVTLAEPVLPPVLENAEQEHYDYVVGAGDVLNITVWDHPELTIPAGSMRSPSEAGNWVHNDGTIFYPYVGNLQVAGLKVTEIRELITQRISRYIEDPQVDVSVAAFRSQRVYVSGSVTQPGAYPVTNVPMRLLDAVNQAGGLTEEADWRKVILTRDGRDYTLSLKAVYERGDGRYNIMLRGGDVVHVGRGDDNKVFVMGEVRDPKSLFMGRNGLTLAEALSDSKGINELMADASGIFVMRRSVEGDERHIDLYQLNAKHAAAMILADEFVLAPRDIIYVTTAPVARWNKVIAQLMPTVQAIYYGALAADRIKDIDN